MATGKNNLQVPTESYEQITLFSWAQLNMGKYPELKYMYHVPNGGVRHKATAGRLKAEGVKSGVPDVVLPCPRGTYHGLYIEMKRIKGGRTSDEQKDYLAFLKEQGYKTTVCKGWQEAADAITKYMELGCFSARCTTNGEKP